MTQVINGMRHQIISFSGGSVIDDYFSDKNFGWLVSGHNDHTSEINNNFKTWIPDDLGSTTVGDIQTGVSIGKVNLGLPVSTPRDVPLLEIEVNSHLYTLRKPLSLKIFRDDDLFFTENDTLDLYGAGETIKDAIDDISFDIVHYWKFYQDYEESELQGEALRLKKIYNDLFVV